MAERTPAPALLGHDTTTGEEVVIGDIARRSGLYILGKPGMGKSGPHGQYRAT